MPQSHLVPLPAVPITLHPDDDEVSQGRNNDRWPRGGDCGKGNMRTVKGMKSWGKAMSRLLMNSEMKTQYFPR